MGEGTVRAWHIVGNLSTKAKASPEEHEEALEDVPEVVMPVDGSGRVKGDVSEQLHANDCIDEEQHHHEHHHIWKSLRRKG